ncbi:MAG: hypothetical protein HC944_02510 [Nanoarchaeota archaeon]|nr:hypothetical protein [Nanoarchaeota archaeon]
MPFKIQYSFIDDPKVYHCVVSYSQYRNFCGLPIIKECKIVKGNETTTKKNLDEIQHALDLAYQKDTSHIRNLAANS